MTKNDRGSVARQMLRSAHLFAALNDDDIEAIGEISQLRGVRMGDVLFRAGDPCSAIYIAESGLIKLYVNGPRDQEKVIEFIEPGDSFAEAALFSGQGYPVSAMASADSSVLAIDGFALARYMHSHPHVSWNMLSVLSRRCHQLVGQLRSASCHSAEQRVIHYLMENYDDEAPDEAVSHLPNRRSELACALGITPETLCRVLGKLRKNGWIETDHNLIYVRAPQPLAELLDLRGSDNA
ncbi:MAG: Crp/Fnr family transcriptional regulator [Gammaproteobacteria bacterium]|nr:Crp/Fnr family transcriptional regulator [Gammaproteobacteria bacterium]